MIFRKHLPSRATNVAGAFLLLSLSLVVSTPRAFALGQVSYVENHQTPGSFAVVQDQIAAPICVDSNDWPGVLIAANNLRADVHRVTGCTPPLTGAPNEAGTNVILIGTVGKSALINQLVRDGKIDVSPIAGQWEAFFTQVVPNPMPGVDHALVIAGSDKRGTIYGIYDLSEEIGVSPWYWWADVPPKHHDQLFVRAGKFIQGPPAVKYRGIFLNDEAPDLTGWVKEKYGDYNHGFYTNIFEVLLRLKANYLWPAMWDNCFNEDDPLNPKLADEYGIVMGTSHVEPMLRADKEWNRLGHTAREWNYLTHSNLLDAFWKEGLERNDHYESIITVGMRGKVDTPMSPTANIALLERIVANQRQIISEVLHTNAAAVPQDWALYKEVQEYYEKGMRVPDDVTLLWCDDNWGDVRRLPTPGERGRSGGAGIYYHFDYVGGPRNYKWLNTIHTTKIWEQMHLAHRYGANQIWIVNVGHFKGYELPIEFFLNLAWNPQRWTKDEISGFTRLWAEQQFGPKSAAAIADILDQYPKYNGRRKPELLAPGTFSLVDYREAHRVTADWNAIANQAERIYHDLPADQTNAFYELVLYPAKACAVVNDLYVAAARNRLYAKQGRASANDFAARVRALFQEDAELAYYYNHILAHGRWNHFMDQTHIGYTYWQQPPSNSMPKVVEVQLPEAASMGVAVEGSAAAWPGGAGKPTLPEFDVYNQQRRFIDVFNQGRTSFEFSARAGAPWINLSASGGKVEKERRLWVSVDWAKAPKGLSVGTVEITGAGTGPIAVSVRAFNPEQPAPDNLHGFVEANGCVSIEAAHYTKKVDASAARWEEIPGFGRTRSGLTIFPVTAASVTPPGLPRQSETTAGDSPYLEYRMYLFHAGRVDLTSIIAPSLNFVPDRGLRFAVSFDDGTPQLVTAVPKGYFVDNGVRDWEESVKNNARILHTTFTLAKPGYHTLKFWMVDPGVVLEKLVVDLGGVKPSYLGPPESFFKP